MCKRRVEDNCDVCAHEVDLDQSLAVFTGPRAYVVEVAWETKALPALQKLPSGRVRGLLVWSMAKVIDVSMRQLSKAKRPSCAPGARTLVASSSSPMPTLLREQDSAKTDSERLEQNGMNWSSIPQLT